MNIPGLLIRKNVRDKDPDISVKVGDRTIHVYNEEDAVVVTTGKEGGGYGGKTRIPKE